MRQSSITPGTLEFGSAGSDRYAGGQLGDTWGPPILLNEKWNYPSGGLAANAPATWGGADAEWQVTQGQYINVPLPSGGAHTATPSAPPFGYNPNRGYSMVVSLSSADLNQLQLTFDNGTASPHFIRWVAGAGNPTTFTWGGATGDAQITDSTSFGTVPNNTTIATCALKIAVGAVKSGVRVASVRLISGTVGITYKRNLAAASTSVPQVFQFAPTAFRADGGVDSVRVSAFIFRGFKT